MERQEECDREARYHALYSQIVQHRVDGYAEQYEKGEVGYEQMLYLSHQVCYVGTILFCEGGSRREGPVHLPSGNHCSR